MIMHVGTANLVRDLWKEIIKLRAQQTNSADGNGACPGGIYHIEYLDAEIVRLIPCP